MTSTRRGLALPAALFTIAIIVLFIAGSAFTAAQEARAAHGTLSERIALEAAEYGATAVLRDWRRAWNVSVAIGQSVGPLTHTLSGGATAAVRLTRISATTWWVVSDGSVGTVASRKARRVVNAVLRLDLPPATPDAALAVIDSASVSGTGLVNGGDSLEVAGICGALPFVPTAGVAAPDTTRVSGLAGIAGTPPLASDSTVAPRWLSLDSLLVADIVLPAGAVVTPMPVASGSACDTTVLTNWGDPAGGACGSWLPVIRAAGDVTLRGGRAQGILVADGDIVLENGAQFSGLVMPRDDLAGGAGGGTVLGAVIALDARRGAGDHTVVSSGTLLRRSSCRVLRARYGAAMPIRVTQRWWAEFE
ncbi:MAG TPA: hypothetical protein VFZ73_02725 [Gemmatimonadaceae bacterium]